MKSLLLLFLLLFSMQLTAQHIAKAYAEFKNNPLLSNATTSLYVVDCDSKKVVFEHNKQTSVTPASTLKLFTTISALELLGANDVFATSLLFNTATQTLHIGANYDPTWSSEHFDANYFTNQFTTIIKKKKWNVVQLHIHTSPYDAQPTNPNWLWGDMGNYFGTSSTSLNWRDNKLTCYFNTSNTGDSALLVKYAPKPNSLHIINSVIASDKKGDNTIAYNTANNPILQVIGELPAHKTNYDVEVNNPLINELFTQDSKQLLGISSVKFSTEAMPQNMVDTASITSPKLAQLVYHTNFKSLNLYAESILKHIGISKKWGVKNDVIITQLVSYWKPFANTQGLDIQDGCGLSPMNKITSEFATQLLLYAYTKNYYSTVLQSLPVMSQSGSLSNMCKGTVAEGRIMAKTGYIHGVRAYSGYIKTLSNKTLAFSFVVNNFTCSPSETKKLMEAVFVGMVQE